MTRTRTLHEAKRLLQKHKLWSQGWRVWISNESRLKLGDCDHDEQIIILYEWFVDLNPWSSVRLTILHEIAHALAGYRSRHGVKWQRICKAIGGNGLRHRPRNEVISPARTHEKYRNLRTVAAEVMED